MFNKFITEDVKMLIAPFIKPGDVCLDLTAGNGNDSLFLAKKVTHIGKVYSMDIQKSAIEATKALLKAHDINNAVFIEDSHAFVKKYVREPITVAMMNLGYLPGADKTIVTKKESTVKAINDTLLLLKTEGILAVVAYIGHQGSDEEYEGLLTYLQNLDHKKYSVREIAYVNRKNTPPIIYLIKKNN